MFGELVQPVDHLCVAPMLFDQIVQLIVASTSGENVKFGDFEIISPQKLNAEQKKERWPKVMTRDVQVRMSGA